MDRLWLCVDGLISQFWCPCWEVPVFCYLGSCLLTGGGFLCCFLASNQSDFVMPHDCCVFEILSGIAKEWNCSSTIPSVCMSCSCCLGCGAFTYSNVPTFGLNPI